MRNSTRLVVLSRGASGGLNSYFPLTPAVLASRQVNYGTLADVTTTPSGTYSDAFTGGVLLPDGRVFCVPSNFSTARIYHPITDTVTTPSGTYPTIAGYRSFFGGVLLPDGRVFCIPSGSTTARIYNPVTDTLTTPSGTYPSSNAFSGGVLLPDGRVFCVPHNTTTARIYGSPLSTNLPMARTHSAYDNKF